MSGIKEDCFAYKRNSCKALNDLYCKNGKCPFYKTKKRFDADKKKYNAIAEERKRPKVTCGYVPSWARQGKTYKEFQNKNTDK